MALRMRNPMSLNRGSKQQGVALITMVLVVAIAVMLSSQLIHLQELSIRRSESLSLREQAYQLNLGLEAWAVSILVDDRKLGSTDSSADIWAAGLPPIPVDHGTLSGRMSDMGGKININGLASSDLSVRESTLQMLVRLLEYLALDTSLAARIGDWVDSDGEPRPSGAEDHSYLGKRPSYRAANQAMKHISELRLIDGVDADVYQLLASHLSTMPLLRNEQNIQNSQTINVNTASEAVLYSLHPAINRELAKKLYAGGSAQFASGDSFIENADLGGNADIKNELLSRIRVNSFFFLVHSEIRLVGRRYHFYSLLERQDRGIYILQRSFGNFM